MVDYKGKHFVLQDEVFEDDYSIGEMSDSEITDEFLASHVFDCEYYGIPPYIGKDELLNERIKKIQEKKL